MKLAIAGGTGQAGKQASLVAREAAPTGRAPDLAGPREESLVEMVRAYARATGAGRFVIPINLGGAFGRAQRDGSLLPGTDALHGTETFNEWLAHVAVD